MDVAERKMKGYESHIVQDVFRKAFFYIYHPLVHRRLHYPVHQFGCDSGIFQFLGARIYPGHRGSGAETVFPGWSHVNFAGGFRIRRVHIRVDHVHTSVECGWFTEKYIFLGWLQFLIQPFNSLEEYKFHLSGPVSNPDAHPLL